MEIVSFLVNFYLRTAECIRYIFDSWFISFFARFVFTAVLAMYFLNSAQTKVQDGPLGFFPGDSAYMQILPQVFEQNDYYSSDLPIIYKSVVYLGTYAEFILPVFLVIGLFTRLSALAMLGFISVMSYVDIYGHKVANSTIGMWFDKIPDSLIMDQRLLWVFILFVLFVKGAGAISVDRLLYGIWQGSRFYVP